MLPTKTVFSKQDPTLSDYEASAEEKYLAGYELLTRGYIAAGVYLLGYATEIWLKSTYFRLIGKNLSDQITIGDLQVARTDALTKYAVTERDESFHSVLFWREMVLTARAAAGKPALGLQLHTDLVDATLRIYQGTCRCDTIPNRRWF